MISKSTPWRRCNSGFLHMQYRAIIKLQQKLYPLGEKICSETGIGLKISRKQGTKDKMELPDPPVLTQHMLGPGHGSLFWKCGIPWAWNVG